MAVIASLGFVEEVLNSARLGGLGCSRKTHARAAQHQHSSFAHPFSRFFLNPFTKSVINPLRGASAGRHNPRPPSEVVKHRHPSLQGQRGSACVFIKQGAQNRAIEGTDTA